MIIMKFGGTSVGSPASIRRVASIVHSQVQRNPIVVVSASGNTTNQLLGILDHASRGESYLAWKLQEEVRTHHFCLAEDLLSQQRLEPIDQYIRGVFRDLHIRMLEVCEGERSLTAELRDWVTSLGECLASRIVAAALQEHGIGAMHLDSRQLILTDEHFTNATPLYWETYAKIRWSVSAASRGHVVVLGGFIGATEDGRTTTLGRGGSDLTASLVGAALNAEEVQVWKDVDGMLTWDPKIKRGGYRVKSLSYEEADELAKAGATILHPETIAPAQRLRIPLFIRNTFRPESDGTRIGLSKAACSNPVKSIACKQNLTVLELRLLTDGRALTEYSAALEKVCRAQKAATVLAITDAVVYLSVASDRPDTRLDFAPERCMEVHVKANQAILTLVGEKLNRGNIIRRLAAFSTPRSMLVLPQEPESCSVRILAAQEDLAACTDILQSAFFTNVDPGFFASLEWTPEKQNIESPKPSNSRERPAFAMPARHFSHPITSHKH